MNFECNTNGKIKIQNNDNYAENDYNNFEFNIYYYQLVIRYNGKVKKY